MSDNLLHWNKGRINVMARLTLKAITGVALAISLLLPTALQAQIAETPCDVEYFKSLESRAWLEAQREITQNQNLIYKPDSVLQYTCFDKFANVMANMQSWQGFSETKRWKEVLPNLDTEMDNALNPLIAPSLITYLTSNFNNAYLNGREPVLSGAATTPGAGGGPPSYVASNISGGAYSCSEMSRIWQLAKCSNFQDIKFPQDGFFTFEEHRADEKRKLPQICAVTPAFQTIWSDQIKQAGLNPTTAPPWPFDKVEVYYEKMKPEKCGESTPLPTGVKVTSNNTSGEIPAEYDEKICIIPGCYYDPNAGTCAATGG